MPIYDKNNVLITNLVGSALSQPDVIEVKNRTLDGQWHIQTIGNGASVLDVKTHLTLTEKDILDSIKKTMSELKVVFDGKYYIGIIDGAIGYERIAFISGPMFATSFKMLVQSEGVI